MNLEYQVLNVAATGARIKKLRKARNLTVEQVAEYMGFSSVQAVYKWQRGESLPTLDNIYALAWLFGTTVDDILVGKKERETDPSPHLFNCFFMIFSAARIKAGILYPSI